MHHSLFNSSNKLLLISNTNQYLRHKKAALNTIQGGFIFHFIYYSVSVDSEVAVAALVAFFLVPPRLRVVFAFSTVAFELPV